MLCVKLIKYGMKKKLLILLVLVFVAPFSRLTGQDIRTIDSLILATHRENHKYKRIKIGNLRTGAVYWFLRKNKKMFAIEIRKRFGTDKGYDSSFSHHYFYKNDSLIKAAFIKYNHTNGRLNRAIKQFYFDKDTIINPIEYKVAPDVDVSEIIQEAYAELKKGYAYRDDK